MQTRNPVDAGTSPASDHPEPTPIEEIEKARERAVDAGKRADDAIDRADELGEEEPK